MNPVDATLTELFSTDPGLKLIFFLIVACLGACMGSFFNVCIYRIPRGVPLSFPGSHCYCCGGPVRWKDNIPLVSYWVLGGHCRNCQAPFSIRYFLIEGLTMLAFLLIAWQMGPGLALIPALILASLLIIATFTDIDHWIIPDRVSLGGLIVGLVLAGLWPVGLAEGNPLAGRIFPVPSQLTPLCNALAGAAAGFISLWLVSVLGTLIFRKDAMGFGDVKLFAMFGSFTGPEPLMYILILACLVGILVGLAGMLRGWMSRNRPMPDAIRGLQQVSPEKLDEMLEHHPLMPAERKILERIAGHPNSPGRIRHHLPFGPSLAIAALAVYLYLGPIKDLFFHLQNRLTQWMI
jgi:leader peptidase (prepilin peptidase)/N-methyltransferase